MAISAFLLTSEIATLTLFARNDSYFLLMKYLFSHWKPLETRLCQAKSRLLLFDYDGTLCPITHKAERALISPVIRKQLHTLASQRGCYVGIVSGRSLVDIQRRVGLSGLFYVGNHGFEIMGPGLHVVLPAAAIKRIMLGRLGNLLNRKLPPIPGLWIENKRWSLSIHYRLVNRHNRPALKRLFTQNIIPLALEKGCGILSGKEVLNILPDTRWNKGTACQWLKRTFPGEETVTLYVGDDHTDEYAFKAMDTDSDITVHVGRSVKSFATYYLQRQKEIFLLMQKLTALPIPMSLLSVNKVTRPL